ncbi:MAG: SLBB domain-containing protein, partial [Bacteroidales bacterium]|nr:SLBB domain-containing protein [Bacteroidales bacterium]
MFRRRMTMLAVCLLCVGGASYAQGTMTDEQVLEFVKQAVSEGRDENEIARTLALRGVDEAQVRRVERLYREQQDSDNVAATASGGGHTLYGNEEIPDTATSYEPETVSDALTVYGRDIFRNRNLNFAPSENLATPTNYRLGPGDEVIIEIFGREQKTIRGHISPEGSINTEYLGPIYLNGMTINEANSYLKRRLASVYGGLGDNESDIRVSLGQIRTIQVNILGDVHNPGTFTLSSFATVFHALYRAGGVVEPGSMRDISVVRNGKTVASVDVYDFLTNGNRKSDLRLEEGDVILVRPYKVMVKADGQLKRPMYFEMKEGETITDLLNYAGGFAYGAYTESLTVTRQSGKSYEVKTVPESEYDSFQLKNGDEIQVGGLFSLFENKISIVGSVYRPSVYELGDEIHTVRELINAAGGLLPDAFMGRAVLHREHDDKTMEVISMNLDDIMSGRKDIVLKNNDELHIASQYEMSEHGSFTID